MPKSTKALKKSDDSKPWNRTSSLSGYRTNSIPINKTILIVCEGQTEAEYFESFPVLTLKVKTIDLGGQSKLKLIDSTQKEIKKSEFKFDEIWCVFDMDVKRGRNEFSDFDNAIYKAQKLKYKVAYSNDAFELWFYLHYNSTESQQLRTFYYRELSKKFGWNYEKVGKKLSNCTNIYQLLLSDPKASQEKAIENAERLYSKQADLPFHQQNPVTKVFELVVELNKHLKR